MKYISSASNPLIQKIIKLNSPKYIMESELCFVESEKVVFELAKLNCLTTILIQSEKVEYYKNFINSLSNDIEVIEISENICNKISQTVTHTGIFALSKFKINNNWNYNENFIVLDAVQDPSNIGAIIRSALAFDIKNIIFLNSAFAFTPKVIRASMGYVFNVNVVVIDKNEFIEIVNKNNLHLISTTVQGDNIKEFKPIKPFGIVVGNEGNGISKEIINLSKSNIAIPMQNNVESLNVAVSLGIVMYELTK